VEYNAYLYTLLDGFNIFTIKMWTESNYCLEVIFLYLLGPVCLGVDSSKTWNEGVWSTMRVSFFSSSPASRAVSTVAAQCWTRSPEEPSQTTVVSVLSALLTQAPAPCWGAPFKWWTPLVWCLAGVFWLRRVYGVTVLRNLMSPSALSWVWYAV
jgi:hypothetical protein